MDYIGNLITKNPPAPSPTAAPGIWTLSEAMQYQKAGIWPPGYQISRSVRLRASATAYFSRTPAGASNRRTYTFSAWVKRGLVDANYRKLIGIQTPTDDAIRFNSSYQLEFYLNGTTSGQVITNAVYRDPSAWYHIVVAVDTTQATAANRVLMYVNGVQVTSFATASYPTQNYDTGFNTANLTTIGQNASAQYFDGYLTEINWIDGQALTPSSFGYTDTVSNVWQPLPYTGTYGTNGFYLNFSDNSAATAAAIGKDYSGNGNNWTPTNISVTAGATYDSMVDSPSLYGTDTGAGGTVRGNYAVLNTLARFTGGNTASITNGNLLTTSGGNPTHTVGTMTVPASGKFYFEVTCTSLDTIRTYIGFLTTQTNAFASGGSASYDLTYSALYASNDGRIYYNTGSSASAVYGATYTTGDVIGVAYDNGKIWWSKNGVFQASGNPSTGANPGLTGWNVYGDLYPYCGYSSTFSANFGQQPFTYTAPSGFVALNTYNLSVPTINNGANYMAATLYTGNGATQTIANTVNNISFQPDLVWVKSRSAATDHKLTDSVRGVTKALISDTTGAETTDTNGLTAFGSTGFTLGTDTVYNNSAATYVGWQWQAGKGTTSSNTSGSITSTVSVNTTAGFSIVGYTGTGANATVGHGLGVAPSMIITKVRSTSGADWNVYHTSIGATASLFLDLTSAASTSINYWNNTSPTSSVFSVGISGGTNNSGNTMIAYCFAPITGYSAFGSYTGNGSTDGPFIYTGFRPRFILYKPSNVGATDWVMWDTVRSTYNVQGNYLLANTAGAEGNVSVIDILSNGFKLRIASTGNNGSGDNIVYAAFAENPFKYARAR